MNYERLALGTNAHHHVSHMISRSLHTSCSSFLDSFDSPSNNQIKNITSYFHGDSPRNGETEAQNPRVEGLKNSTDGRDQSGFGLLCLLRSSCPFHGVPSPDPRQSWERVSRTGNVRGGGYSLLHHIRRFNPSSRTDGVVEPMGCVLCARVSSPGQGEESRLKL